VFRSKFSYSDSKSSYSDLLEDIETGKIESIFFYPRQREIDVLYKNGNKLKIPILYNDQLILEKATENKVDLTVNNSRKEASAANSFASISLFLIFILAIVLILRSTSKLASRAFGFTKNQAKFVTIDDVETRFDDVAGVPEAAEELKEVITFLKEPKKFENLGAKVPKGVLLIGPPGTGKTLLAKAIAGESGVPFLSISASEFVELFVGVGASRVRDLFSKAKEKSPCIIFIDEIDAVGRQRGAGMGGGNDEREQTLNQLLTEMDGFEGNSGIIIVAATNRPDVLDSALMRPGRFDRQVTVDRPDYAGRLQILNVHAKDKTLSKDVDLDKVARRTPGFTGADLANLLNEAAILAARKDLDKVSNDEVGDAIERVMAGPEQKDRVISDKKKELVAYHEAGHALVGALMPDYDPVAKVSIIPRGQAGGLTFFTPSEERMESGLYSRSYLQNQMAVALGGRVAEEIVYGEEEVTTGASNDLQQVANVARQMITKFGMSDKIGPVALGQSQGGMFLGRDMSSTRDFSEDTAATIDVEVSELVDVAYKRATKVLSDNRTVLDEMAQMLIERETIDTEDIQDLLNRSEVKVANYI